MDFDPHCSQKFEEKTRSASWFVKKFNYFTLLPNLSKAESLHLLGRFAKITRGVKCAHDEMEILSAAFEILSLQKNIEGHILEAGCFKGGSAAKFSIIKMLNRKCTYLIPLKGYQRTPKIMIPISWVVDFLPAWNVNL